MGILLIILVIAFIFIKAFCENKNFIEIMLISIETTLMAIVCLLFRDDSNNNLNFLLGLASVGLFIIALVTNIYEFKKNGDLKRLKDKIFIKI
ncbi:TPA: hypothetical protein ACOTFX_000037 [Clostridium perfringens]|uniref:hypothetical protein n=1 Tax=Clostridium perfringens TaxID=1502 RepID=UPI0006C53BA7|nr:hypothetical protein [Clostridium perfringens]EHK2349516.1 hypothetical protein [Clostridium perfringens]MDH5065423.1 hypothetical protein [Clostridium perfringens]MDK0722559.1 hypothetical protein [Clostridium perfringens]MDK0951942.1 hypothetical protein [Clostridium perfringens]MDK0966589.1 hypothetical protein [Clostridium perfringens]